MTLQEAYDAWVKLFPGKDKVTGEFRKVKVNKTDPSVKTEMTCFYAGGLNGQCCYEESHLHEVVVTETDTLGGKNTRYRTVPLPDDRVCARERAWRDYVRIRDAILNTIRDAGAKNARSV